MYNFGGKLRGIQSKVDFSNSNRISLPNQPSGIDELWYGICYLTFLN